MSIPEGAQWFIGAVVVCLAVFAFMTMLVVYNAATEASEYFERENKRHREAGESS